MSKCYDSAVSSTQLQISRVLITVEGGVIQDIQIPSGIIVEVRDYDTDGVEDSKLTKDNYGDFYVESIYTGYDRCEGCSRPVATCLCQRMEG